MGKLSWHGKIFIPKRRERSGVILMVLFLALSVSLAAQDYDLDIDVELPESIDSSQREEASFSVYGYLVNFSNINFYTDSGDALDADIGNILYMRLKGDFDPEDALHFHFEASYTGSSGNQNTYALLEDYGLLTGYGQSEYPYNDFVQSFTVDHLWGSASIGLVDLQFGKMPIAWGTGYVFNPTARTTLSSFLDTVSEETPGTIGISPSVQLASGPALQGYLAFQDKNHSSSSDLSDGDFNNLPFGMKLQSSVGNFDLSAGFIKEVVKTDSSYLRKYYTSWDFAGAVWNFGVYGEAALQFPGSGTELSLDYSDYEPLQRLEFCVGFDYTFSGPEILSRVEYYHNGPGSSSKDGYDNTRLLSGEVTMQGQDYFFGYLEKIFIDYLTVAAGGLVNINDGSAAIFPEISYEFYSNFLVTLGGYIFTGAPDTEFGGDYGPLPVDLADPALYLKMKLSF